MIRLVSQTQKWDSTKLPFPLIVGQGILCIGESTKGPGLQLLKLLLQQFNRSSQVRGQVGLERVQFEFEHSCMLPGNNREGHDMSCNIVAIQQKKFYRLNSISFLMRFWCIHATYF